MIFINSRQSQLVKKIAYILTTANETLAVAESSTGGLVSADILSVPGSSNFFIGGSVLYSYKIRDIIVDMGAEEHKKYGGSTPELVSDIAMKFKEKLCSTWVIAEGGAAGPSKSPYGHSAGYTALAVVGPIVRTKKIFTGKDNREQNMSLFTDGLLELFLQVLEEQHPNIATNYCEG
jgi:PncC family amidohydrolase